MRHWILEKHRVVPTESLMEWIEWSMAADCDDQCRVTKTTLSDGDVEVSTVFLGRDLKLFGKLPMLFETMVFGGKMDEYTRRYSCWQDAEMGHEETVKKVKESIACINGKQS